MRKSLLKGSEDPIYVVNIEHLVTATVFATALTDYCYNKSIDVFDSKMKKVAALEILKRQLRFAGDSGEYGNGEFESTTDAGELYNSIYDSAKEWVLKNYPYLKK